MAADTSISKWLLFNSGKILLNLHEVKGHDTFEI